MTADAVALTICSQGLSAPLIRAERIGTAVPTLGF